MAIFERIAEGADGRRRLALKNPANLESIGELALSGIKKNITELEPQGAED